MKPLFKKLWGMMSSAAGKKKKIVFNLSVIDWKRFCRQQVIMCQAFNTSLLKELAHIFVLGQENPNIIENSVPASNIT